jgi:hypothetical protein
LTPTYRRGIVSDTAFAKGLKFAARFLLHQAKAKDDAEFFAG